MAINGICSLTGILLDCHSLNEIHTFLLRFLTRRKSLHNEQVGAVDGIGEKIPRNIFR